MKCLVLAAGYATRLYPLTENFPKPLLSIGGKTILDWLIDDISGSGEIEQFVIISNHKFLKHFENWSKEKEQNIVVLDDGTTSNETRLGAVMDIQFAIESLNLCDDLLIIAGDNVLDFSLKSFVDYAKEKNTSCIMRYYEENQSKLSKSGVLEIGENDRVLSMEEKPNVPKSHWCCPPFYFYTSQDSLLIKKAIEDGCGTDAPGSYVSWLATKSTVHAMEMPGKRYDIGNLESYEHVKRTYNGILIKYTTQKKAR